MKITDSLRVSSKGQENLHDRLLIMNTHSFIYNQLSAEIFEPMLLYAWQSCRYDVLRMIEKFDKVLSINFDIGLEDCENFCCSASAILKCAHCGNFLRETLY